MGPFRYLWASFANPEPRRSSHPMTRHIALLVFPGVQALDVTGPMDVFAEANRFLPHDERYVLTVIGTEPGPVACCNGLILQPHHAYSEVAPGEQQYDLVLAAGGAGLQGDAWDVDVYTWLRRFCTAARRHGSICNGAFVLAHAGLLAGRTVTTHWNAATALGTLCPDANVVADNIFVQDGALYTSAGVTAGIDLALYLVAQDHGKAIALDVAKRLVVFTQRAGGQSQFSPYLMPYTEYASPVAQVQAYVREHLAEDLSVGVLAGVARQSLRNFARVFAQETRMTPAVFVESARIDAARVLLEQSHVPLKRIASQCGFGDAHTMRQVFKRRLGITPQQYRAHFLSPGDSEAGG